jgi:NADH:ubiquinone oxidoreductase subunit 6 (subunit J)
MIELIVLLSLTVISAFLAIADPNIVYGVIFLLCTNILLGIIYYMVGAQMPSLFQLAIFAGAIVVFFLITIMLTRGGEMEVEEEVNL